jgi:hypothetical protein
MSVFKIKYLQAPGAKHVYLRVFSAPSPQMTYRGLGNLTVTKGQEFEDFKLACSGIPFEDDSEETPQRPTQGAPG